MPPASKKAVESKSIDRYQLKEPIGRGGMGLVYRAYDPVVRRDVALKTIRGSPDRMAVELFRKECSVLASLSHPNIIEIFDIGEFTDEGESKPYFVMPLLPGVTLGELIRDAGQRLTVDRAVEIIMQTCRGLQAAHENGVVHRDLKPSNIFVMQDDSVKIIDFGMVHMVDTQTSMTIKGGTLPYMAPEQVQMQPASALSDIFALGVVFYETLTRRRPFEGSSENEVVQAILNRIPPPASDLNPAVSQLVSRVVHKAIAKQPWYRFSSAREFSEILQKALRSEPIEIFDAIRIQPRIQRATKATEQSDYQFAGEILSELEAEGHLDPAIPFLRSQIEKGKRQKTILQLLESARTRIDEEEYLLALQKIQDVLQLDPNNTSALSLRNTVENRRSEQKIDEWFRLARQHLDNHAFSHARGAMQSVLQIKPKDTRAEQMLAEIDRREQEYLRIRTEKEHLYQSAVNAWQGGDVSVALTKLERLVELDRKAPDSSAPERGVSIQSFYNQVRSEHDALRGAYEEARKHLVDRNFMMALTVCDQYLTKYPGHALFQALKFDVEERQRQEWSARIAEIDRSVEAEPDLERRVNILKEALDLHPGEVHFERALRLMRDKRDLVQSIVNKARNSEGGGQFNEALGQWEILQSVYHQYPGLEFEIERVKKRRDQLVRTEAKSRWVEQIDRQLESGDFARAMELLRDAVAEFPGDAELSDLEKLARQGSERINEAQRLLVQGRDLCAKGRYKDGIAALRKAYELDERNSPLRSKLVEILLEQARAALDTDWESGELLVQHALMLDPGNTLANSLRVLALDRKREQIVTQSVHQARRLQTSGDFQEALAQVEQGLASYPDEPRLVQLSATLQKALQESCRKRDEFVMRCVDQARELQASGDFQRALAQVEQGLAAYPQEIKLVELSASLQKTLRESQRHQQDVVNWCVNQATKLRDAGDLPGAVAKVEQGLTANPDESKLIELQASLKEALGKSREELVAVCLGQARQLQESGDLKAALARIEQALSAYPGERRLVAIATDLQQELRESQRKREEFIALCLVRARELQQAGNLQAALAHVEQGLASYPDESRLTQLWNTLKNSQHRQNESVAWCLNEVRKLMDGGDFERALAQVEQGISSYPQDLQLREIQATLHQRLEDYRRKHDEFVRVCLSEARELQTARDPAGALARVAQGLSVFPGERELIQLSAGLQKALQESRRKRDEVIALYTAQARELQAAGDLQGALGLVEQVLTTYAEEPGLLQLSASLKKAIEESKRSREEVITWYAGEARRLRDAGDLPAALVQVEQGLSSYPRETKLRQLAEVLTQELEESQRKKEEFVTACTTKVRELQDAGDQQSALAQVKQGLSAYPDEPRLLLIAGGLERALQESRRKRDEFIALCMARCRELQEAGNLQAALEEVTRGITSYPDELRLNQLSMTLQKALEDAQRRKKEFVSRCVMQVQRLREAGDLKAALAEVEQALSSYPEEFSLRDLEAILHQALEEFRIKREELVLVCLAQTRELQAAGKLQDGLARVEQGLLNYPDDSRLQETSASLQRALRDSRRKREDLITRSLTEARKLQGSGDLQSAMEPVQQALSSYPDDDRLRNMLGALQKAVETARNKQEEFVSRCVGKARKLQASGNLKGAVSEIEQGLSYYPTELSLIELHATLVQALEEFRRRQEDFVIQSLSRAHELRANGDVPGALAEVEQGLSSYPDETRLLQLRTALQSPERRAWYRRPIVLVPVLLLIAAFGVILKLAFRSTASTISLDPEPRALLFNYRMGSLGSPNPQDIVWNNPSIPFSVTTSAPWLVVTPDQGDKLNRLRVSVQPQGLQPGDILGTIRLTPKTDAKVIGTLVISVHLVVDRPAEPAPPGPVAAAPPDTLEIDPSKLDFEYQVGGQRPDAQQISVSQGQVKKIESKQHWLKAERGKSGIRASVEPEGLDPGTYPALLVLVPSSGMQRPVHVTLTVTKRATASVPAQKLELPKPVVERLTYEQYKGVLHGDASWQGELPPGGDVRVAPDGSNVLPGSPGRITNGAIPLVRMANLTVRAAQPDVTVDYMAADDQWRIRNNGRQTLEIVTIHWTVIP